VVDADDLIAGMVATAREMSAELGKLDGCSEEEANAVSTMVGLGALKYFILKVDPRKTMLFDPRESIDFNGNTGPFIQYTHARICSILRKATEAGIDFSSAVQADYLPEEIDLVKTLTEYPSVVAAAGENFAPSVIGAYVYELAKQFNGYYHDHSILKEENDETRRMRLQLAQQVAQRHPQRHETARHRRSGTDVACGGQPACAAGKERIDGPRLCSGAVFRRFGAIVEWIGAKSYYPLINR